MIECVSIAPKAASCRSQGAASSRVRWRPSAGNTEGGAEERRRGKRRRQANQHYAYGGAARPMLAWYTWETDAYAFGAWAISTRKQRTPLCMHAQIWPPDPRGAHLPKRAGAWCDATRVCNHGALGGLRVVARSPQLRKRRLLQLGRRPAPKIGAVEVGGIRGGCRPRRPVAVTRGRCVRPRWRHRGLEWVRRWRPYQHGQVGARAAVAWRRAHRREVGALRRKTWQGVRVERRCDACAGVAMLATQGDASTPRVAPVVRDVNRPDVRRCDGGAVRSYLELLTHARLPHFVCRVGRGGPK